MKTMKTTLIGAALLACANIYSQDSEKEMNLSSKSDVYEFKGTVGTRVIPKSNVRQAFDEGVERFEMGDYSKAISSFSNYIRKNPKSAEAYMMRNKCYRKMGRFEVMVEDATVILNKFPKNAEVYYVRAFGFLAMDDIKSAIRDFTSAIKINPTEAKMYYNRGIANGEMGYSQKAIEDFTKAIELNPHDADYYFSRGLELEGMGMNKKAILDFSMALELRPDDAECFYHRAFLFAQEKQPDNACADLQSVISLDYEIEEAKIIEETFCSK